MRIDPTASPLPSSATRVLRRGRSRALSFAVTDEAERHDAAGAAPPAAALTTLTCLLPQDAAGMADGAGDAKVDQVAAGQCRALLGALAGLQLAALGGGGVQAQQTLADLARALPRPADPGLDDVLRAIAQRAAIELARAG